MKIIKNIINSKVGLFISLGFIALIVAILLNYFDSDFSYHDILVEFHGLVFDLFVFGVVLTIYETQREKKVKKKLEEKKRTDLIERYKEELNDYRFWKSEEAFYRIRGLIERLVKLEATDINLSHCFLPTNNSLMFKEMKNWKFSAAQMNECAFSLSDMSNTESYHTNLIHSSFREVNLTNAKFGSALLLRTKFEKCKLENAELDGVAVSSINWFQELKNKENVGIESLMEKYYVNPEPEIVNDVKLYRIRTK